MSVALAQPHRAWLPKEKRLDQHAESELGRLFLARLITQAELDAGQRWRQVVMNFHSVMVAPVGTGSPLGQMVGDSFAKCEVRTENDEDRQTRVLAQHGAAMCALRAVQQARDVFTALERVVIDDRQTGQGLDMLRAGLQALADLWGMTGGIDPRTSVRIRAWSAPPDEATE